jgi:hypothetical protein
MEGVMCCIQQQSCIKQAGYWRFWSDEISTSFNTGTKALAFMDIERFDFNLDGTNTKDLKISVRLQGRRATMHRLYLV